MSIIKFYKVKIFKFHSNIFWKKFLVLCDLGLIIIDDAMGKPIEIINLLFAKTNEYNDSYVNYCFNVIIDNITYTFSVSSDSLKRKWVSEIEDWIFYNFNAQIFPNSNNQSQFHMYYLIDSFFGKITWCTF